MHFNDQLLLCIQQGDNAEAQTVLQEMNPCEMADISRTTLLHVAADCGNSTMTKYLIDRGCNVDAVDDLGNTPLILALQQDHAEVIRVLFYAKASILITNKQGKSAAEIIFHSRRAWMHLFRDKFKEECSNDSLTMAKKLTEFQCSFPRAMLFKNVVITKYMLDNGYNVNDRDANYLGFTALHKAVLFSDLDNVKLLVDRGADVNAKDRLGKGPLNLASDCSDANKEILMFLLDRAARLIDDDGRLLVSDLFRSGRKETVLELLTKCNLNLMAKTAIYGVPLAHLIFGNKNFDSLEILKSQNFDIDVQDANGMTLLTKAIYGNNTRTVEFLLANGANVNLADNFGITPLFLVFIVVGKEVCPEKVGLKYIQLFLEYGVDLEHQMHTDDVIPDNSRTVFGATLLLKCFPLIKPVLAQLALKEDLGGELADFILTGIHSHAMFRSYFDFCKRTLAKMKRTVIHRATTLFQCLTENRIDNFIKLSRNVKLVSGLESMMHFKRRSKLYYHKMLRKQAMKMIKMVNLRKQIFDVVSQIHELQSNTIVVGKIVDYVIWNDLKVIAKIV